MTNHSNNILSSIEQLKKWRCSFNGSLVLTNGVFDLIHYGHIKYLQKAKLLGDKLLVAINSDASVKKLKGHSKPINSAQARAYILAALRCVDAVIIFQNSPVEIINQSQANIYVKGADYSLETLNPKERYALEKNKVLIQFIQFEDGYSSSSILEKFKS